MHGQFYTQERLRLTRAPAQPPPWLPGHQSDMDAFLSTPIQGRIPVKWMAIESLFDHIYTTQSDV